MIADLSRLTTALSFAAEAHRNQRRKGAAQEPYINHLIEVLDLVVQTTGGADMDTLIAALLHDVVEDTPRTYEDVARSFGERVAEIVRENSDDMSLPKDERRRARIAAMAHKSREARVVKMADVISNLRAIAVSPPAGWSAERKLGYLEGCRQLVDAARGTEASIERIFDETAADVERTIRNDAPLHIDGCEVMARQLASEIGQPVHLVYLLNTEDRALKAADVDRLCELIGHRFPAATVQPAEAVYERGRRSILMVRIRTDSTGSSNSLSAFVLSFGSVLSASRSMAGTSAFTPTTPNSVVSTDAEMDSRREERRMRSSAARATLTPPRTPKLERRLGSNSM